jgi:hypothetical protein
MDNNAGCLDCLRNRGCGGNCSPGTASCISYFSPPVIILSVIRLHSDRSYITQ